MLARSESFARGGASNIHLRHWSKWGDVADVYRQLFPRAHIHCFEPIPDFCALLRDRFASDAAVTVNESAVSDTSGQAYFTVNAGADTSSLLRTDLEAVPLGYKNTMEATQNITVSTVTIDDYCAEKKITSIDVLKLDIQGGELGALRGAEKMLRTQAIKLIYAEVFFLPFYKDQPLFGAIAAYLGRLGYALHGLYNPTFSGMTGRLQWSDCIFVHQEMAERSRELQRSALK